MCSCISQYLTYRFPYVVGYKQTAIKKSRVASEESNCTKRKYKEASAVQVEENIAFEIESIVNPQNPYFETKVRPARRSKLVRLASPIYNLSSVNIFYGCVISFITLCSVMARP